MRMIGIMLLLALLLQGCGHKGAMYLPQQPSATPQSDTTPTQPDQNK